MELSKKDKTGLMLIILSLAALLSLMVIIQGAAGTSYVIGSCTDLQGMQADPAGNYSLVNDIDCTDSASWNSGTGFMPIENFTGQLNGNGFVISNFYINRSDGSQGLFSHNAGYSQDLNVIIQDLGMENVDITCGAYCGAIAGWNPGYLLRSYATGSIHGTFTAHIGGLVGVNQGIVNNSWSNVSLCGYYFKGGIISDNINIVENTYAVGGFGDVGVCDNGNDRAGICAGYQGSAAAQGHSYFAADVMLGTRSYCPENTLTQISTNISAMQHQARYDGWDFTDTWQICTRSDPTSLPTLRSFGLCCQGDWSCTKYTACGELHQDCLAVHDSRCGYVYDPDLDGSLAAYGRNCTINAQSQSVDFKEFDLRYSSNVLLFIGLILAWLIMLGMAFAFSNYILYAAAFMLAVFVGIIAAQISWIISVGIMMIMVVIGINYLGKFEN